MLHVQCNLNGRGVDDLRKKLVQFQHTASMVLAYIHKTLTGSSVLLLRWGPCFIILNFGGAYGRG